MDWKSAHVQMIGLWRGNLDNSRKVHGGIRIRPWRQTVFQIGEGKTALWVKGWASVKQDNEVPRFRVCDCTLCKYGWLYGVRLYGGGSLKAARLVQH